MNSYATDTPRRSEVIAALVLVSIILAILINGLIELAFKSIALTQNVDLSKYGWLISPPTVFAVYGFLWWVFDNWVWKWLNQLAPDLLEVPNLNGIWTGTIKSSHDNFTGDLPVSVQIKQSWSSISIILRTENSNSRSLTASILTRTSGVCLLSYDYLNEPRGRALDSMNMHRGTGHLELVEPNKLEGQYYTSRGRKNHGEIYLERKP